MCCGEKWRNVCYTNIIKTSTQCIKIRLNTYYVTDNYQQTVSTDSNVVNILWDRFKVLFTQIISEKCLCKINYLRIRYILVIWHISYRIIPYHITPYLIVSYRIIYHIISYHIISYHIISYHIASFHIR